MGLLQRLKHDLKAGLATLRLGTAQAANRALEETELLRLRLEIRKLDARPVSASSLSGLAWSAAV